VSDNGGIEVLVLEVVVVELVIVEERVLVVVGEVVVGDVELVVVDVFGTGSEVEDVPVGDEIVVPLPEPDPVDCMGFI
jgi:hypothetical protein